MSTGKLNVLSYNISFEGMTNNSVGSAGALGSQSKYIKKDVTISGKNIADFFEAIPGNLGIANFDLVGLQEASKYFIFKHEAPNTIGRLVPVHCQPDRSEMVSYYDDKKFELEAHYNGKWVYDRPFQILVLKYIGSEKGIIFFNVHNPHPHENGNKDFTFDQMAVRLTAELNNLSLTDTQKSYRIIGLGDFNETGMKDALGTSPALSFKPFSNIDMKIEIANIIKSCNQGNGIWDDGKGGLLSGWRGGDFIFDSLSPSQIFVPTNYDGTILMSDHLPVMAQLDA